MESKRFHPFGRMAENHNFISAAQSSNARNWKLCAECIGPCEKIDEGYREGKKNKNVNYLSKGISFCVLRHSKYSEWQQTRWKIKIRSEEMWWDRERDRERNGGMTKFICFSIFFIFCCTGCGTEWKLILTLTTAEAWRCHWHIFNCTSTSSTLGRISALMFFFCVLFRGSRALETHKRHQLEGLKVIPHFTGEKIWKN